MRGRQRLASLAAAGWAPGPASLVILVVLALVPQLSISSRLELTLTIALVYAIAAVGLGLFSGYSGQLALGNFGFVAIGAYASVLVVTKLDFPVILGLPAAIAVAGLVAFLLALPMVRLPYLGGAVLTFFFATVVSVLLTGQTLQKLTQSATGLAVPTFEIDGTSFAAGKELYYLGLVILALGTAVAVRYATCRAGRTLRLIKRSNTVAAALGVNVGRARISAFVFSGMLAGAAGFVYAQTLGYIAPESFAGIESVNLLAMVVVGGLGTIPGPILGAVFFNLLIEFSRVAKGSRELVFALALLAGLVVLPAGIYGFFEGGWSRLTRRLLGRDAMAAPAAHERTAAVADAHPVAAASWERQEHGPELLAVHDLSVSFGGVKALRGVELSVAEGSVHAIIGPNGAGKTTLLNCISGLQAFEGSVVFDGGHLEDARARSIRRRGIVRTFQNPSLVPDLSVIENVELGAYGLAPSGVLRDLLPLPGTRRRDREARRLAEEALDLVNLPRGRHAVRASDLSLAEQKIVDIARAICGRPRLLLLDEPSAGLGSADMEQMIETLRAIARYASIVVIAHHVGFLRAIADSATVLNFGEVIAQGETEEVTRREDVTDIYLGKVDA